MSKKFKEFWKSDVAVTKDNIFESPEQTIRRIRNTPYDPRYDDDDKDEKDTKKTSDKFKVGDRVTPLNSSDIDYGKKGTVRNVNSGGGIKVDFDDGESETYGGDELRVTKSSKPSDEDILLREHLKEMGRKGAEDYNIGWATGDNFIHSKTSKGRLFSQIDPKTKKVTHTWQK